MRDHTLISFDYAIKYLLKDKGDYEIVEGFISTFLQATGHPSPVKIKALLEPESNREGMGLKRSIADLIVEDSQGCHYIVEIDRQYVNYFLNKACFSTSRLIVDNMPAGEMYASIKKVIHISLLYFVYGDMDNPIYHGKTVIRSMETGKPLNMLIADLEGNTIDLVDIFPEYTIIAIPLFNDIVLNEMDEWLYLMKHSAIKDDFQSPYMAKVAERLNVLHMTPVQREAYDRYQGTASKENAVITSAEDKGRREGLQEGRKEGLQEGKKAIAKKMLLRAMPIDEIVEFTGLSQKEIQESLEN